MKKSIVMMAVMAMVCGSAFAQATTYYVDAAQADDSGAGISWATAKQTIQAAVD